MRERPGGSAAVPADLPAAGARGPATALNTTDVRERAKARGIEVRDRGRAPAELVAKFKAATAR